MYRPLSRCLLVWLWPSTWWLCLLQAVSRARIGSIARARARAYLQAVSSLTPAVASRWRKGSAGTSCSRRCCRRLPESHAYAHGESGELTCLKTMRWLVPSSWRYMPTTLAAAERAENLEFPYVLCAAGSGQVVRG